MDGDEVLDTVERPDGSFEVTVGRAGMGLMPMIDVGAALSMNHFANLAEIMDEGALRSLAIREVQAFEDERGSREPWNRLLTKAKALMGLTEIDLDDDIPEGAQVASALMLTAAQRSIASAFRDAVPQSGPCAAEPRRGKGQKNPSVDQVTVRVAEFFNGYLMEHHTSWAEEHLRTIKNTVELGCGFKKIYADPGSHMPVVIEAIDPENLIVSFHAKSLRSGVAVTHRIPNLAKDELQRRMHRGLYRVIELSNSTMLGDASGLEAQRHDIAGVVISMLDDDQPHEVIERHCMLVLTDDPHPDGLPRPYVLTIHRDTESVLALRRNWEPKDPLERPREHFTIYQNQPGESHVYAIGLLQILYTVAVALKEGENQSIIAAWAANKPIGVKSSSFNIRNDSQKLRYGEFMDVDAPVGDVSKAFALFPFRGVDPGLLQILERLDRNGRELAGIVAMNLAEVGSQAPVGTVLAAMDEAELVPGSTRVNLQRALARELRLVQQMAMEVWGDRGAMIEGGYALEPGDLELTRLVPVMSGAGTSRARRIMEAQGTIELSQKFPQAYNQREVLRRYHEAIGTEDIDQILTPEPEVKPADPISEFNAAMANKPLKAGMVQDHDAHMRAHIAQMKIAASQPSLGDAGQVVIASLQAHIAEHLALSVAVQAVQGDPRMLAMIEQGGIPPQLEVKIAPFIAQAMEAIAAKMGGQDQGELALQLEQIRNEGRIAVANIQAQAKTTGDATRIQIAREHERAQTTREVLDNAAALRIAGMRDARQAASDARADAIGPNAGAQAAARAAPPR